MIGCNLQVKRSNALTAVLIALVAIIAATMDAAKPTRMDGQTLGPSIFTDQTSRMEATCL